MKSFWNQHFSARKWPVDKWFRSHTITRPHFVSSHSVSPPPNLKIMWVYWKRWQYIFWGAIKRPIPIFIRLSNLSETPLYCGIVWEMRIVENSFYNLETSSRFEKSTVNRSSWTQALSRVLLPTTMWICSFSGIKSKNWRNWLFLI